jgi:hypothetical protein
LRAAFRSRALIDSIMFVEYTTVLIADGKAR